jgi:probable DNA metabolism protein
MGVMNDLLTTDLFPQAALSVALRGQTDFEGFRRAARGLLAQNILPGQVSWQCGDAPLQAPQATQAPQAAGTAHSPAFSDAPAVSVPPEFLALCQAGVMHRNPQRFQLLYRLLWRLVHEPELRHTPQDADMAQARLMAEEVREDIRKMKAQVRFRSVQDDTFRARPLAGPLHVAWYAPEHHIVEAVAPTFAKRFSLMRWAILTPEGSVESDYLGPQDFAADARPPGEGLAALRFGPNAEPQDAPAMDAGPHHWLAFYEQVFHPARLARRRMLQKQAAPRSRKGRGPASRTLHAARAPGSSRAGGQSLSL